MARAHLRQLTWDAMQTLQAARLGHREIVSHDRDKFVIRGSHPAATRLTTQPDADGFIRADSKSLLFRLPSATFRSGLPSALRERARKLDKGLQFGWAQLEEDDITTFFSIIRSIAGIREAE